MDAPTKGLLLGFGMVLLSIIVAIIAKQIHSGYSAFGTLGKSVEVPIDKVNLEFHKKIFRERLSWLGFKPAQDAEHFVQGSTDVGEFGAGPHARTKKFLSLSYRDAENDRIVVTIALRYAHLVGVDEGEAAYCDAVLDYVSGKTDEMANVPRHSIMALNSLVGGVMACLLAAALVVTDELALWLAIPTLGVTEFGAGLLALYSIWRKPEEISGRGKAIAGILLSLAAVGAGLYFILWKHSGSIA